jgi:hypothetical protein
VTVPRQARIVLAHSRQVVREGPAHAVDSAPRL